MSRASIGLALCRGDDGRLGCLNAGSLPTSATPFLMLCSLRFERLEITEPSTGRAERDRLRNVGHELQPDRRGGRWPALQVLL